MLLVIANKLKELLQLIIHVQNKTSQVSLTNDSICQHQHNPQSLEGSEEFLVLSLYFFTSAAEAMGQLLAVFTDAD